jgi:hypothetical protein
MIIHIVIPTESLTKYHQRFMLLADSEISLEVHNDWQNEYMHNTLLDIGRHDIPIQLVQCKSQIITTVGAQNVNLND